MYALYIVSFIIALLEKMVQCERGTFDEAGKTSFAARWLCVNAFSIHAESLHCSAAAISHAGGSILKGDSGIELKGWRIESCKAPISSESDSASSKPGMCDICALCKSKAGQLWGLKCQKSAWHGTGDADMEAIKQKSSAKKLPEQLFGDSLLCLSHEETGVSLSFTALDALQAWRADDRKPVRVEVADEWMRSRERDVQASGAVSLDYDWWAPASRFPFLCMGI